MLWLLFTMNYGDLHLYYYCCCCCCHGWRCCSCYSLLLLLPQLYLLPLQPCCPAAPAAAAAAANDDAIASKMTLGWPRNSNGVAPRCQEGIFGLSN